MRSPLSSSSQMKASDTWRNSRDNHKSTATTSAPEARQSANPLTKPRRVNHAPYLTLTWQRKRSLMAGPASR